MQTMRLQEGIADFFPVGQNLAHMLTRQARRIGSPIRRASMAENAAEKRRQIGIGIKHRQDGQRGDGEKGKRVAGAGGHDDLFQTGSIGLPLS